MSTFILQTEKFSLTERSAVRYACAIDDSLRIAPQVSVVHDLNESPACPVGTVEFCREWMQSHYIPIPSPIDYPDCLSQALGRSVKQAPFALARLGHWVKPVQTKAWDAHIKTASTHAGPDDLVWECEPISKDQWVAEWRVYVLHGQIVGDGRYDEGLDESARYDADLVRSWVDIYTVSKTAPAGYAMDVALMSDGQTILVEVTDGWAIGYYKGTCSAVDYARLLSARWDEIKMGV